MQTLVIDAICGVGFPSTVLAAECEALGLAKRVDIMRWEWDRKALYQASLEALQTLYQSLRETREAVGLVAEEPPKEHPKTKPELRIVHAG